MKKLVLTILTLFYLGVSSGATVHFHYCMGQLIEWGLSQTSSEKCSSCGRQESETGKCCKDQSQLFKVEKSQKAALSAYEFNLPQFDLPLAFFNEIQPISSSSDTNELHLSIPATRKQNTPAFIRNCNFRI
ncbi:HYC_CC_PP family protein [Daejeonella sp.]|uniref:HYC_CC_PP family protein n=1 Tax=Daejeonella sp. TaxID=2805397 RepID=UPI0039832CC7